MNRNTTSIVARRTLLLSSLCCFLAAAVAAATVVPTVAPGCPSKVVVLEDSSTPLNITLVAGNTYRLGAGVYVLTGTVEVAEDAALW
jgi:hypothetical protein